MIYYILQEEIVEQKKDVVNQTILNNIYLKLTLTSGFPGKIIEPQLSCLINDR